MSEPLTIGLSTHLFGAGPARATQAVYVLLEERHTTARALLGEYVRREIAQLSQRRATSLALHYMLATTPTSPPTTDRDASSIEAEIASACAALSNRHVLLLVDGTPVDDIDAPLSLTERSQVRFVRLLPLIGG